jgi:L-tartrate/succinate antiporter
MNVKPGCTFPLGCSRDPAIALVNGVASSARHLQASGLVVVGSFFVIHYLFASVTAHATALLPVFLTVAVALPGLSPKAWALVLAYTFGIMGILTPYATGPSPIYFGSGDIKGRDFWVLGAILGAAFLAALILVGVPWLRLLGV